MPIPLWELLALVSVMALAAVAFCDAAWIPLKDLIVAALWPVALVKRTLSWRGHQLSIGRKSRLFVQRAEEEQPLGETG